MAKPVTLPDWATDTNISSGSESGTPTKVDPGSGYRAQGFVPGLPFVGPYVNYILNLIYSWLLYLNGLHNEVQFLNKTYAWTGPHSFATDIDYILPTTFTRWLEMGSSVGEDPSNVAFDAHADSNRPKWQFASGTSGASVSFALDLPSGATITSLDVVAEGTTGHVIRGALRQWTINGTTGVRGAAVTSRRTGGDGSTTLAMSAGVAVYSLDPLTAATQVIDRANGGVQLSIGIDNTGTPAASAVLGVRVQYTMPGYRNG